jgi:hypothetical protein
MGSKSTYNHIPILEVRKLQVRKLRIRKLQIRKFLASFRYRKSTNFLGELVRIMILIIRKFPNKNFTWTVWVLWDWGLTWRQTTTEDGLCESYGTEDLPGARRPQRMDCVSPMGQDLPGARRPQRINCVSPMGLRTYLAPDDHRGWTVWVL